MGKLPGFQAAGAGCSEGAVSDQWADMSQTLGRHREEQFWSFCRASGNVLSFDILKELPGKI